MKKLSFFLVAMILSFAASIQAAEVTETITMKGFAGSKATSYENVTKTGASDLGTAMVAYAFNPSTGQVRGSKTTIAGASVTSTDNSMNWSLYNSQAMPGAIKAITVTQTATGSNKFQNNLYVALGTTTQGAVTTVDNAQKNKTVTTAKFTFDIDESKGYTYFKLLSNAKFTSGSVAGVVVTVTYVTGDEDPNATMYTVTTKVNDETMGTVTGAGEYAEGKTATLTANPKTGYKFVNWSNGETANPLRLTVTKNVEITANFAAIPPMTCAEAAATASGETVVLNPFDVVAVVKDAGYIYIKDESGVNLIFDYNLDDQLKAGDHVEGFIGISSPYNGLPEIKPSVSYNDLTVTPGVAPEPTVMAAAPTKAEVNQYVKFENVTLTANATFTTASATNATMVVNGNNVTLRNNFKLAATLDQYTVYDVVGFVAIYNSAIQVYFLSATEVADLEREEYTISWSVNGTIKETTTVLEGDKLVLPTAPAAPEACSEKVFMGWTAAEEVKADGSDIEWVTAATIPTTSATYYAVFATQESEGSVSKVVDVLDNALTGITGTTYASWSGKTATSTAVYAGQSAGDNNTIQLRSKNSNSGVISTTSGGKLAKVTVTWNSSTAAGRTLDVYGSNTAYTSPSELYGDASGEKLGAIVKGTSTELVIDGDYAYVGLRSNDGAMYLDKVQITWSVGAAATYTDYCTTCEANEEPDGPTTALDNLNTTVAPVKAIINGQLVIINNGVQYNAQGQVIR